MPTKKPAKISTKYLVDALDEYEPGSDGQALRNLLGVTSVKEMDRTEARAYIDAERTIISTFRKNQRLQLTDIHFIHRTFLGGIYRWAGTLRSVNISKAGFTFATAFALPGALDTFDREVLQANTPCLGTPIERTATQIAIVHAEFLLLHPYREGNGRTARLLATLMAYQAGMPGIDFGWIGSRGKEFNRYVAAVQMALDRDYEPMRAIVLRALRRALRRASTKSVT